MDSVGTRKIVILSGSLSLQSSTKKLLIYCQKLLENHGANVDFLCVRDLQLPMMDPGTNEVPSQVTYLRETVRKADAVLVGSPEYHAGPSGALKNAIDYLEYKIVGGKPVGLICMSGGPRGGINTLNSLRLTFRALHTNVIPEQLAVCSEDLGPFGETSTPQMTSALKKLLDSLLREAQR